MDDYQNKKAFRKTILRRLFSDNYVAGIVATIVGVAVFVLAIVFNWDLSPRRFLMKIIDGIGGTQKSNVYNPYIAPSEIKTIKKDIFTVPELPEISYPKDDEVPISSSVNNSAIEDTITTTMDDMHRRIDNLKKSIEATTKEGNEWKKPSVNGSLHQ